MQLRFPLFLLSVAPAVAHSLTRMFMMLTRRLQSACSRGQSAAWSSIRAALVPLLLLLTVWPPQVSRAQTAPSTEVYLVSVNRDTTGWTFGVPTNVTRFAGYDNQPSFSPDGQTLYFTRIGDDAQADIWRMHLLTGQTAPVARTAESEYSAWPTTDGSALTVVRVESDSAQRLWRLPVNGEAASLLVSDVKPVGYFTFPTANTVAMFVLGSPATLQVATLGATGTTTHARNIGRSLHTIPGTQQVSFVQKGAGEWFIVRLDPVSGTQDTVVATRPRREDYAWLDSTTLLMGDGTELYAYTVGDAAWRRVADFAFAHISDISRLALSPNVNGRGPKWLAVTASPPRPSEARP